MKFYIDIDETMINSIQPVLTILNKRYNQNFKVEDVKSWDFKDCFPQLSDGDIEDIFDSEEFFELATPKSNAHDFINMLISCGVNPIDISFVTKGRERNLELKREFLKQHHLGFIDYIGLPLSESKSQIDMSDGVLIDDCQSNLFESNAMIRILFKNTNNADWNNKWVGLRVRSMNELILLIRHFILAD